MGSCRSGVLYRRGVLVYGVDIVCEPCRHDRTLVERHFRGHPPGGCSSFCRRAVVWRLLSGSSFRVA